MKKLERIEWCDLWVTGANETALPRLLLVGDSITRSYFSQVEEDLQGVFLCARLATSICVSDRSMERELALLLDRYSFDVIHFNNGLHGWEYCEASYAKGLARRLDFITRRSPRSQRLWAHSTPIRQKENLAKFDPRNDRVRERNR
ncbi:MAG: SGNH/GDSL hydrolase family protein, partial [Kiritimatiellia bacterium]|nr:SGNH/GDSL hydrolase family protein [Kiritimatiellia bacterium]